MVNFIDIFGLWLLVLVLIIFLSPIEACWDWIKRGTSDGYPSFPYVWASVSFVLWLCYGRVKGDGGMVIVNGIGLVLHIAYILVYDFYCTDKKYLHYQVAAAAVGLTSFFVYLWELEHSDVVVTTGRVSATFQSLSCIMGFYGIYCIIKIKTTEYMPFRPTAYGAFVCANALIFSLLVRDVYMIISNLFNALLTCITASMYFIYPPQTWQLPWQRKKEKEKTT